MDYKAKKVLSITLASSIALSELAMPVSMVYGVTVENNNLEELGEQVSIEESQVKINVVDYNKKPVIGVRFGLYEQGGKHPITTEITDKDGKATICGSCLFNRPTGDYEIRLEDAEDYRINENESTYGKKTCFDLRIKLNDNGRNTIENLEGQENKNFNLSLDKRPDTSFIRLKVVNMESKVVEGVAFEILDSKNNIVEDFKLVSDSQGKIRACISNLEAGKYGIRLKGKNYELLGGLNDNTIHIDSYGGLDPAYNTSFTSELRIMVKENEDIPGDNPLDEDIDNEKPIERTEESYIKLRVIGRNNMPVDGVEFIILDNDENIVNGIDLKSDRNGLIRSDISRLRNGKYKLTLKDENLAALGGLNDNSFKVTSGKIDQMENSSFKGQKTIVVDKDGEAQGNPSIKSETSFIRLKIKNKAGLLIDGMEFILLDKDEKVVKGLELKSDINGLVKTDISELPDGSYSLKLKDDKIEVAAGLNNNEVIIKDGEIDIVSNSPFKKEVSIIISLEDEDWSTEGPKEKEDLSSIDLKIQEVKGGSLGGIEFVLFNSKGDMVDDVKLISNSQGVIKADISNLSDDDYTLELKGDKYQIFIPFDNEFKIIKGKIDSASNSPFKKRVNIVVEEKKDNTDPEKPQDKASSLNIFVRDEAGKPVKNVEFEMYDKSMYNEKVYNLNLLTDQRGSIEIDMSKLYDGTYELVYKDYKAHELPENKNSYIIVIQNGKIKSIDDKEYKDSLNLYVYGGDSSENKEPKILDLNLSINSRLGYFGAPMDLTVIGQGLTKDNIGYEVKTYFKGSNKLVDNQDLEIVKKENNVLGIVVPENKNRRHIVYEITVGILRDGKLTNTKKTFINQNGTISMINVTPKSVIKRNAREIVVEFPKNITMGTDSIEELKEYIYISELGSQVKKARALVDGDTVEIKDNKLIIKFKDDVNVSVLNHINIDEGALITCDEEMIRDFKWSISFNSEITGVEMEKNIYDSNGGQVVVKVNGNNLDKIKDGDLVSKVYKAGKQAATDIETVTKIDEDIFIYYTVPENIGKEAESYYVGLELKGTPAYMAKPVVTVLPKGADMNERFISALTLSGNNKIKSNEDSTDIEILVKPTSGELKVILSIYGANLSDSKTEVRAIDEYGVIWPVYHCPV